MAGTITLSCAPGACRSCTRGGPASVLPLIIDARSVVASGSRLGESFQSHVIQTPSCLQGETKYFRKSQCATSERDQGTYSWGMSDAKIFASISE